LDASNVFVFGNRTRKRDPSHFNLPVALLKAGRGWARTGPGRPARKLTVMAQEALGQSRLTFTLSDRDVEELLAERGLDPFPRRMLGISQRSLPTNRCHRDRCACGTTAPWDQRADRRCRGRPDARPDESSPGGNPEIPAEPMVRRLPAGGKWIRTFGPSQGMSQIRTVGAERDIGRRKRRFLYGGTDGSNPVPSGSQSVSLVPSAATGTKDRLSPRMLAWTRPENGTCWPPTGWPSPFFSDGH
jgi:hypothetical protein